LPARPVPISSPGMLKQLQFQYAKFHAMKLFHFLLLLSGLFLYACTTAPNAGALRFSTEEFQLMLGREGQLLALTDLRTGENYIKPDCPAHLLSIRVAGEVLTPQRAEAVEDQIHLFYGAAFTAKIAVEQQATHLVFELLELDGADSVELVVWGPYATRIEQTIGETVGVVRDDDFAIGIQSLNLKTLGGYPWNESDRMPAFDVFRADDPTNMHPAADGSVLYRVEAARPIEGGSTLQAYCRNRSRPRIIQDFQHDKLLAPAYEDGGVVGSKIALFGCPTRQALSTLGAIELAEGLPHPLIDGQWGKEAPGAAAAYIISDFTEANIDQAIALTKKAGLRYLYHYGKTFESWGHFELYEGEFPEGIASLKRCVDQAAAQGVMLGTHVLSNFITTNDAYVTPVPDERLAIVGSAELTAAIDEKETTIPIQSPDFFNQMANNSLKTIRVGTELIRYGRVSDVPPWYLLDCQRGAFGTQATKHTTGSQVAKLLDHPYKVFLTNADLTIELSETMAKLYNQTGLRQISFDGLEGNRSTGLGTYGESLMPYTWYQNLSEDLRQHLIIDASRTTHFFWHIYTRMNWGEPWYGGFRESQTEYRFNNQAYFQRNYMPGMLGWFKMTPQTSMEDLEWLLAKSAGYDAGYAFVANMEVVGEHGQADALLERIGVWEQLRLAGAFTEVQKERMRAIDQEFSLQGASESEWLLYPVTATIATHDNKARQPGAPGYTVLQLEQQDTTQALQFTMTAIDSKVSGLRLEIDNYKVVELPVTLDAGQILQYKGTGQAMVYDANWRKLSEMPINDTDFRLAPGAHSLSFDCDFHNPDEAASVKVELRSLGQAEVISLPQ